MGGNDSNKDLREKLILKLSKEFADSETKKFLKDQAELGGELLAVF
jgi:hypothetical protein